MPENKQVTNNQSRYRERLKQKYPEKEFLDEESLFGQINDDYDDYDSQLSQYQEREKSFSDLFTSNPKSAAFLMDWRKGEDPVVGMMRRFGSEFKDALDDPERQEALAEAQKEYIEKVAEEKEYAELYEKNIAQTNSDINKMQEEEGISDEDITKAIDFLQSIFRDAIIGKFSPENIKMALKSLNYDGDIEEADREGEVRGRNQKIEERLRKPKTGDGTASLAGKNGGGGVKNMPDLGALGRFSDDNDIYKRGGYKRTSRTKK